MTPRKPSPLTDKQIEAMELVCLGKTRDEIVTILGKAKSTVSARIEGAKKKLGANRTALAIARYVAMKKG